MVYSVDSHSCVIVFMSILQSIRGAANQSVCSAQIKMHGLTRPPWLGVARRFNLAAPRSLVFFIPLLTEHTHSRARARVLTLTHTRARASSHSRSHTHAHGLSFTHSLRSLLSFSCLSLATFIGFRMGSWMQKPFSTGSIIIIVLPLSLAPSLASSLSLNHFLPVSLSLSLPVYSSSHTLVLNTLVDGHCVPEWESHRSSFVAARTFRAICFYKWPCA